MFQVGGLRIGDGFSNALSLSPDHEILGHYPDLTRSLLSWSCGVVPGFPRVLLQASPP